MTLILKEKEKENEKESRKMTFLEVIDDIDVNKVIVHLDEIKRNEVEDKNIENYETIYIYLDTCGGVARSSISLFHVLRGMHCNTKTIINGRGLSAGSIIFCGGDSRIIYPQSEIMIHQATISSMYANERIAGFKKEHFEKMNKDIIKIYEKTSLEKYDYEYWFKQVYDQSYYVGKEIFDVGLGNMYIEYGKGLFRNEDNEIEEFDPYYI